jgi:hypothetical protein
MPDAVPGTCEEEDGFGETGKEERADEGSGNGAGEGDVVKVLDAGERAVMYYVVCGLDVEALFDLGVRGYEEVNEDEGGD